MISTCLAPDPSLIDTLQSYLARLASDSRSPSVVVSDEDGLVICGIGDAQRQAAIAAWCAAPAEAREVAQEALEEIGVKGAVHVTPIEWGATRLHLASEGAKLPVGARRKLLTLLG